MNFSAYSIKNPILAILLFSLFTLGGLLVFEKMKVQQFPDIDLPAILVTVTLPGAAPEQMETEVAKKIEDKLSNLDGVKHIRSTLQTGAASVHTEFTLQKDINEALDEVRSAMSEVADELPAAAKSPVINKVSTAGFMPVVAYSVSSTKMDQGQLSWFVDDTINRRLSSIDGVGSIKRLGGIQRQVLVTPHIDRLTALGMPISQLSQQLAALQKDASGGEMKLGGSSQNIRILAAHHSIADLEKIQIQTPKGVMALGRLASISDSHADISSRATLDGEPVVAFTVARSRGASDVTVAKEVAKKLEILSQEFDHIQIHKIYDNAAPIQQDYQASLQMLLEGCILAVAVVLLFLKDWRATLVTAVALPLSIIPAFLVMQWLDFSLNVISLLALSLVIGVLVDDAIVEVENIMRHLHMGKTPMQAAMEAANEIGLAVVATTFTLIAVFLPTAFMDGVVGQFFQQFGWTAAIAVFISLLVARLVTPMMAAYFLVAKPKKPQLDGRLMTAYLSLVKWTLSHRGISLGLMLAVFVGSLGLAKLLPSGFIPPDDNNQTQVTVEMTPDASLDDTQRIASQAAQKIRQVKGVASVFISAGASSGGVNSKNVSADAQNIATLNISLRPRGDRPSKQEIENQIRQLVQMVPSARFVVGLSATGDSGYNFSLVSSNPSLLNEVADQVIDQIQTLPEVVTVSSNKPLPRPELSVLPDPLKMADQGVTTDALATTLRIATVGDYEQFLAKLDLDSRQIPIVVRLSDQQKQDLANLNALYIPSQGGAVQLSSVADLKLSSAHAQIRRLDKDRVIKISVQSDAQLGALVQAVKSLPILTALPDGVTMIDEGQAGEMKELFLGFLIAMGVGVFCIFGVLMLLFHKVLQPLTILIALPLSVGGAFLGLLATGSSLSMPSMIGLIMLMGIATKNSILLVDYAITAERLGMARLPALLDACQKRARPIIMTTVAMGAGMLPLLLGLGDVDATFRRPMAAAVLGGLLTSTFLSLVIIPVFYSLMEDLSLYFRRLR